MEPCDGEGRRYKDKSARDIGYRSDPVATVDVVVPKDQQRQREGSSHGLHCTFLP